jgi:hypothetical protein
MSAPNRTPLRTVLTIRSPDVGAARKYLAFIEAVARHGRKANKPDEVIAALRTLATPSSVLTALAGVPS